MSQPRHVVPYATYLFTRRVLRRQFLLRPEGAITDLIIYVLAVTSGMYGIEVHAICVMSSHLHMVITDTRGELPRFLHQFDRLVALSMKVLRAWEGPFWEPGGVSAVRLLTPAAVVEKIAYVLANPVAAGLVRHAHEWPGLKVRVGDIGRGVLHAGRPVVYFDPANPQWPEHAAFPITLPPGIEKDGADGFRRTVAAELAQLEAQAHEDMRRQGHRFLGAEEARAISPYDRATSFEALRARNPTFAVGREQGDAWRAAAAALRVFRASYRGALERWCAGMRDALFPVGTWWMRVFHRADVNSVALPT
jgi:putative transposase